MKDVIEMLVRIRNDTWWNGSGFILLESCFLGGGNVSFFFARNEGTAASLFRVQESVAIEA